MISIKQNVKKFSVNPVEQNAVKEEDLLEQTEFNGQTGGLSVESIGCGGVTYRIQLDCRAYLKPTREISPSNVFCQLNGCELKPPTVTPTDKTQVIADCSTCEIQQPANTATR
ncbi:unnamed protein product [Heterobilharzia americana]|nr:unnamed protein product [Heterobilharzia americana]